MSGIFIAFKTMAPDLRRIMNKALWGGYYDRIVLKILFCVVLENIPGYFIIHFILLLWCGAGWSYKMQIWLEVHFHIKIQKYT